MLSRVAENLYWLARYVERAENTARIVTVNANLLLDLPKGVAPGWRPLVDITGANALFEELHKDYGERQVVRFLLADERHSGSILMALSAARENCRTMRDIVPREFWEQINGLHLFASGELQKGLAKTGRHAYLRELVLRCQTLAGLLDGTMLHDQGYEFLLLGRYLERADMTTRIADVQSANLLPSADGGGPYDNIQWVSVLKSMTAYQMYRRSEQIRVQRAPVLRFIFKSPLFPRSVRWCIEHARRGLERLPRNESSLREVGRIARLLDGADLPALTQAELHDFVDDVQLGIANLHGEIAATWFPPPLAVEEAA
ncbi:MAG: alpha-E domain-containing protein [Thiohalocapsa sp.]|uniref:alpha-E domain-containing protein n=1 Tax=Thiohalocapsa sp. TaxID=2497641 RepID=UPI0025D1F97F|nr:alpha-E domain-containing protein [Thiohalocapsa sp.]MCG6940683.1 alpha-E domain-containing protein [Thiohalocapsa sp.]